VLLIPVLNPPKKTRKRSKKVATKKSSGRKKSRKTGPGSRGGTYRTAGSKYTRKTGMSWSEAARASGAVYPKKFPRWHKKAGKSTGALAGKPMTKGDALRWERPVVGYLNRKMIKGWNSTGATARKGSKKYNDAVAWFKEWETAMKASRKVRRSHWKRKPERYKRGKKKGRVKKDYTITKGGKVKFRAGRGPVKLVKTFRGFSPSKPEIEELVAGGYAGHMFAPGGKVKLNKPRRRKKARRRRPAAKKNPRRRKKAKVRKNPRRKKASGKKKRKRVSMYNNPKRRRRKKKTTRRRRKARATRYRKNTAKKNPRKRRRRKAKARKNPVRRRRRRKAPIARRRRRRVRRYRRNPGVKGIFKGMLSDIQSAPKWITAGHILLGAGLTGAGCSYLLTRTPLARIRLLSQRGILGSVSRLAFCGLAAGGISALGAMGAKALGNPKLLRGARTNLLIGGMAYALANFIYEVAPQVASMFKIPQISAPRPRLAASPAMEGWGPDYKYGYGGMGAVVSPEDLVAGESLARNVNEFSGMGDWMELSGLGSSGGAPIPMEDLRGYPGQYGGGMGDWVELTSDNALVKAGFDPGVEAF
jgi:hypothetical protein